MTSLESGGGYRVSLVGPQKSLPLVWHGPLKMAQWASDGLSNPIR